LSEPNNLLYFIQRSTEFLKKKGIPQPRLEAEILLAYLLKIPRIQLYAKFELPLSESEKTTYRDLIKRRSEYTPTAYLIGTKNFYGIDFIVNPHVLIPRPETEELVEILFKGKEKYFPPESEIPVWDLCTGSGNVGIALKSLVPSLKIISSDASPEALEVAISNAKMQNLSEDIQFIHSRFDDQIPEDWKFRVIVSNPPYIPESEKSEIMPEVLLHEPQMALFIEDFDHFHTELLTVAWNRLINSGWIALESHPKFIHNLDIIASNLGYINREIKKDLSGKDRFFLAQKPD
jgi:release factor glutamine methyltransferase